MGRLKYVGMTEILGSGAQLPCAEHGAPLVSKLVPPLTSQNPTCVLQVQTVQAGDKASPKVHGKLSSLNRGKWAKHGGDVHSLWVLLTSSWEENPR